LRLRADDDAVRQFREALRNLARLQEKAAPWRGYIDREHSLLGVELVQPGRILEKRWADCATAVAFSATLSPPWHALEELGLPDDRTDTLAIPDLVDSAQRLVLRYTGLSTRYDDREGNLPQLAHLLSLLPDSTEGGWLVFFPSHAFLEAAATALQAYPVQVVPHRAGTPPALAQRLLERAEGPALHLMALGGAMAEGVGWEQADLHGAVVVSPGFHPPSPDRELRRIVWDDRGEDGFLRAYLLPSMARIVQAAGRLLRSTEQRGVILLVGQRFGRHDIAEALPASWRESMMVEEQQALVEAIREWW
jgi:DNA excision repair protein ERCC-2